jgi:hypothetical protein
MIHEAPKIPHENNGTANSQLRFIYNFLSHTTHLLRSWITGIFTCKFRDINLFQIFWTDNQTIYIIVVFIVFILCSVSIIVCVVLCTVFRLIVVLLCVMGVICLLCLIVLPLPPGKNPFAVKIYNKIIIIIKIAHLLPP